MRRRDLLKSNDRGSAEGHSWIQIGGVKWATTNIGAEKETDYGLYFQWGDTAGYTSGQCGSSGTTYAKPFYHADYKFNGGRSTFNATGMTKYNASDGKTVLDPSDDAATLYWGGDWRMPTTEEFQALSAATTSAWTADYEGNGAPGLVLTSTADSSKKLFFPAAGYCYNNSFRDGGSGGNYWSSYLYTSNVNRTYSTTFSSSYFNCQNNSSRFDGFSVRPVLGI